MSLNNIFWREQLPDDCPPSESGPISETVLLRLVPAEPAVDDDFHSNRQLGYALHKKGEEASWASCSMFLTAYEKHKLKGLTKFKRLKKMAWVAFVKVDETSGYAKIDPSKHVDLWMYASYKPAQNVVKMVKIDEC